MNEWTVYSKDGLTERCKVRKIEYGGEFMGACSLTVSITSPTPIHFELGDYIEYRGERFEMNYDPSVLKQSSADTDGEGFTYDGVVFNALSDELTRCDFLDYVASDNELHYTSLPTFSFFADSISKLAERIRVNLDRIYTEERKWTIVVHPEYVNTLNVNISVSNNTVWDALGFVNSKFGANFIIRNRTITIGTTGIAVGKVFSYGKGNGLYKIERNAESGQKIITRLRAYGSTRNLPTDYYRNVEGGNVPNNMAVKNLMLPDFPKVTHDPYIDSDNVAELGVREGTVFFDGSGDLEEIYPTMEGMTAEDLADAGIIVNATGELDVVKSAEQITDNGVFEPAEGETEVTIPDFTITLKDIGFDINDYLSTSTATISMQDGMCGGREFEIVKCEKSGNDYVLTCHRSYDDGLMLYFPYSDYQIKSGDKYVLLNIEMPDVYIQAASQRLLVAAKAYLAKNDYVRYSYTPSVDNIFMARQHDEAIQSGTVSIHDTIKEGDLMLFEDADLGVSGSIIISSLKITEDADKSIIPEYDITLKNEQTVGTIEKMQNQISSILSGSTGSGSGLSTEQVKSLILAYGAEMFLSKTKDDETKFGLKIEGKLVSTTELEALGTLKLKENPITSLIIYNEEDSESGEVEPQGDVEDDETDAAVSTNDTIYSALKVDMLIANSLGNADERYIRKDTDDGTEFNLSVGKSLSVNGDFVFKGKTISSLVRYYDEEVPEYATDVDIYSALMVEEKIKAGVKELDDIYIRKDKEDIAHKHIVFEEGITVYGIAKMMNIEVSELATIAKAILQMADGTDGSISSSVFVDGFAGEGFQIWKSIATGDWNMTLDRLTVRKVMTVYELLIQKIRAVGGMIVVSAADGKIKEVSAIGTEYKITFEEENMFVPHDLMRCQVFNGGAMKYYWVEVTRTYGNSVYARISDFAGVEPEAGDECVLMGNTVNKLRQNLIMISATEDGQPRFDCLDGVKTTSLDGCLKVRVGSLDGISDKAFPSDGQPQGYGLYGNNCYLTGVFMLSTGVDVETQFLVTEGLIRTEISSVRTEVNEKDNYLKNSSFSTDMDNWEHLSDVSVFNTSGGLLGFNGDFYSEKRNFAHVVAKDGKNVLRIKCSYIKQKNGNFASHPVFKLYDVTETDDSGNEVASGEKLYRPRQFYISFKYIVGREGTLRIFFEEESNDGSFESYTPINIEEFMTPNSSYAAFEASGKWNGTGDFFLSFDGDIYIYDLVLTDNALADLEERFENIIEITDKKIQANLTHIKETDERLEEYRSEFLLTAHELETTFEEKLTALDGKLTEEYTSHVTQTARTLESNYTALVNDTASGIRTDYSSKFQQTAEQIATKVAMTEYNLLVGRVTTAETTLTQKADETSLTAFKSEVNLKTGEIDNSLSNLKQRADSISLSVTDTNTRIDDLQDEFNQANEDLQELDKTLGDFKDTVEGAFKDGLVDQAEAIMISSYLNTLKNTKESIDATYDKVYGHEYLSGDEKTNLSKAKTSLDTAYNNLVDSINSTISDGLAEDGEILDVESKFRSFDSAIDVYNKALEEARYKITGYFAEQAVKTAENALYSRLPEDWQAKDGTYASSLVQMAEGISTLSGRFNEDGTLIEGAGWITEATGNTLWATKNEYDSLLNGLEATQEDLDAAAEALAKAQGDVLALDEYIDGAFKDGVITSAEAAAIEKYINTVNSSKAVVNAIYNKLYNNEYLSDSEKSTLKTAYMAFDTATKNLVSSINLAISDGNATTAEAEDVDSKFALFNSAYEDFQDAVEAANEAIQNKLKGYSDEALEQAEAAKQAVSDLNDYIDGAFKDGVVDESEKIAIREHLNTLATTMKGVESTYQCVIENKNLTGTTELTLLKEAYNSLVSAYNTLVMVINDTIDDSEVNSDELSKVNSAFVVFNTTLDEYNEALENARFKISMFYADKAIETAEKALYDALPEDYKTAEGTYASALRQMAEGISAVAGRFDEEGKLLEGSGWVTTSQGTELWATRNEYNELGDIVKTNHSELSVRIDTIEAFVGEGSEGDFDRFKELVSGLTDDVNANAKAAAEAKSAADAALETANTNFTLIEQTKDEIKAQAARVTTDSDGNILNISTSGLVLTADFAGLFSTHVNEQGIAKTASLSAYVLLDELGDLVSKIDISADQIDLEGVVTYSMFSDKLKLSLATSQELEDAETALTSSISSLNKTVSTLQTEVEKKASIDSLNSKVASLNAALESKADTDLTNAVVEGSTLIVGGYINTDLIQTSKIVISSGNVTGLGSLATKSSVTSSELGTELKNTIDGKVTQSEVDSSVNGLKNNLGALAYLGSISATSSYITGLGALAVESYVEKSRLGSTIIDGSYIKTELINASAITIKGSQVEGLGSLAAYDTVQSAMEKETIIVGGMINTSLINADDLIVKRLYTTNTDGCTLSMDSGGFVCKDDSGNLLMEINADGIQPAIGLYKSGTTLTINADGLWYSPSSGSTVYIHNGGLTLGSGGVISNFSIGNIVKGTPSGTTDFAKVSASSFTLPSASSYKGKVIFVKLLYSGDTTIKSTDGIYKGTDTSTVTSYTRSGRALFFVSDGTYWYEFECFA